MRHFISGRLLILFFFLLSLQYALASFFSEGSPNLLSLLVLDYAFFFSWEKVPAFSLAIGLVRDFIGGHLFGIETLSFAVAGFLLHLGIQKLDRDHFLVRLGVTLIFVWLTETLSLSLGTWLENSKALSGELIKSIFWTTISTTALEPVFFALTDRWFKRNSIYRQYELFA